MGELDGLDEWDVLVAEEEPHSDCVRLVVSDHTYLNASIFVEHSLVGLEALSEESDQVGLQLSHWVRRLRHILLDSRLGFGVVRCELGFI